MHTLRTLAAVTGILFVVACGREPADQSTPDSSLGPGSVATVNGMPVEESLFRLYSLNALQKDADALSEEERTQLVEDLIRFRLLAEAARERGLLEERTMAAQLELTRLQLIARAMAVRFLEENPATEAELREMYENNLGRLARNEYKARHILVETEEEAEAIIRELNTGSDFADLAREKSTGPTGPSGGDLGWFSADSMVEPFADAVRAMQVGTHSSEPVRTRFGWHVILLEDIQESQPPGLETVRAELTNSVERQKLDAYIDRLREAAAITVLR